MKKVLICLGVALLSCSGKALASELIYNSSAIEAAFNSSPLCLAITKGDVDVVKKFLEYGADVNETSRGLTPLMYAAHYNQPEIVKLLIEKGARIEARDEKGNNAMAYAEKANATEALEVLRAASKK